MSESTARRPLRVRSLRVLLPALLVLAAAAVGLASYAYLEDLYDDRFELQASQLATGRSSDLQGRIDTWMQRSDPARIQVIVSEQGVRSDTRAVVVMNEGDLVVAATRWEWIGRPLDPAALRLGPDDLGALNACLRAARKQQHAAQTFTSDRNGLLACNPTALLFRAADLQVRRGGVLLYVYDLTFARAASVRQLREVFAVFTAAILFIAVGLGVGLHLLVTRRLERLEGDMRSFAAGRPLEPPHGALIDEVELLQQQFHTMAADIGRERKEREEAERAVREREGSLRALGDNLSNGLVYQVVRENDGTTRFVYLSAGIERLNGLTASAVLADPSLLYGQLVDEDAAKVAALQRTSFETMSPIETLVRMRRADGQVRTMQLSSSPRRLPDGRVLWDGLQLDVTDRERAEGERRQLEAQLRQAQKLEAVGTLAGGIAHDFNNILSAIISYAELTRLDNPGNAELEENIAQILHACRRASSLVQRILLFSRQQQQERKSIPLRSVVREALDLLRATLPATIAFDEDLGADLPNVLADPTRMHQVVVNLGTNAAHAMKGGRGRLTIRMSLQRFRNGDSSRPRELAPGDYVCLAIADTGHGMSPATLQRIFEPFFTTKAPGEGTGLGLSVVHGIIKEHEGAIVVESEPGRGTTFRVFLPVADGAGAVEAADPVEVAHGNGERILFVDDEPALCDSARALLTRAGFRPAVFADPRAAWEAFSAHPDDWDLVITDLTMPQMTGVELAARIRDLHPDVPILLASGYVGSLNVEVLNVSEVLEKPLEHRTVLRAIQRALRQPRRDLAWLEARPLQGAVLLVVEDDPINQAVAREILTRAGAAVTIADSGLEATRLFLAAPDRFGAILMDVQLPVMDGYEATRVIRAHPRGELVPIIAMTGSGLASDRRHGVEAGMNDHVAKPCEPIELVAVVARWLSAARPGASAGEGARP